MTTKSPKTMAIRLGAVLALALGLAAAAQPAEAQSTDLVFSVTEGVTYQATPKEIRDKFEPLAEVIGKALKRTVKVVLVPAYNDARAGLARQEYDLAFIHPAHVAMAEIKSGRYRAIAWTGGYTEYTVSLLAKPERPFKDLGDVKGHTLVTPDPDSITAVMVRAMLRGDRIEGTELKVRTTRYQDAVPFYIENGFADFGATAANSVVKEWTDKGGKVVLRSRAVPIKQFIASNRLSQDEREKIREALLSLAQTEPGRRALAASGYKGFVAPDAEVEKTTIAWLGL
ncbi:MAG TPA: PhnD/SsuA/transferrin family substrate-binding protein [Casimicrobiaceae bacterium]|nr:PhnD/SsuA/transferrin family substrate-binding protein [Casimicrobiaceae bacterium]